MLLPMVMFTNRIMAALFTIAIATSLIVVSGGLVGFALAKKEKQNGSDMVPTVSSSSKDSSTTPVVLGDDSTKSAGDTSGVSGKNLRSLSKCQSTAAEDGDLTQAEVTDCYHQV